MPPCLCHSAIFAADLFALSRNIPISVNGLAEIAAAAGQAGIAGQDLIRFTEAASKIGVAFDISADQAGGSMANLMTALGLSIDETISLADAMNFLSNSQASSAADILDVVQRVGAQATMFGFTAEQTSAFASAMLAAGAQSDVAATSFRNMGAALTRGTSATAGQRRAFRALGLDAVDVARWMQEDAVSTTVGVLERISQLPAETRAAVSTELFGSEARALGPLLTNLDLVRETLGMVAHQSNYAGSAFAEFEARNRTFQAAMQRFSNIVYELKVAIGNALLPVISELMDKFAPMVQRLTELATAYPEVTVAVIGATAAIIAFKGAMAALSFAGLIGRGGVLSMIAAGYNTIGRASIGARAAATEMIGLQSALAAMNGTPLGAIGRLRAGLTGIALAVPGVSSLVSGITAIGAAIATISLPVWGTIAAVAAAVAAAGVAIWRYWDRISAVFRGVSSAIGEALAPAFEAIRPVLDWFAPLGDAIASAWGSVASTFSGLGDLISSVFTQETLTAEQKQSWEQWAHDGVEGMINAVASIPARIGEYVGAMMQAGRDFITGFWDGVRAVFDELVAWVDSQINRITEPFVQAGATIRSYLPSWAGGTDAPAVDGQRAQGGPITRGGTYLVGENGPELITANRNGYVNPAGSGPGGGVSVSVNAPITINGSNADPVALAAEVTRQIREKIGEAFRGVYADTGMRFT